jgi:acetoin:2,6-dichlorophenolindophenol oxidoreductase subunit alpha
MKHTADHDIDRLEDLSAEFYRQMFLIRTVEERLLRLFSRGLLRGTVHTSIGQEPCAVGVINALDRERDLIFSNHRAHGHFLAWCDDAEGLIAEVMGSPRGVCGGIGGSQHLHTRNFVTTGVQGGLVPCAVGAALAEKRRKSGAVTAAFLGDGTMGEGVVYESFNLAALWRVPILFVLEDNGIAQTTPKASAHAGELSSRADSFGIPGASLIAADPVEVRAAARRARDLVLEEGRPYFLSLITSRLAPHSKGDDTRSPEEIEFLRRHDPVAAFAGRLAPALRAEIEDAVRRRVEDAVEAVELGPGREAEGRRAAARADHVPTPDGSRKGA